MKIGNVIDSRYEIVSFISSGGTADVYKAKDLIRRRDVAIKVMLKELISSDEYLKRFLVEAEIIASLRHINIVQTYGFGVYENRPFIAYECMHSPSLGTVILKKGPLVYQEWLEIFKQLLLGIKYIHQRGLIHADIKPDNIFYGIDGIVKISDFGISTYKESLKNHSKIHGSIPYLAPEVIQGHNPSIQSDIYALGITLYELIIGELPFKGESYEDIAKLHLTSPFPNIKGISSLDDDICNIIYKCCYKSPLDRYQNIDQIYDDLIKVLVPKPKKESFFSRLFRRKKS